MAPKAILQLKLDYLLRKVSLTKCKHCSSTATRPLNQKTNLGYDQYHCNGCGKQFNERTGTPLNFVEYPTKVVMMVVFHYVRYKLSLNDVVEMMSLRGIHISHQTVHNWVHQFATLLAITLRKKRRGKSGKRRGKVGKKWHIDATYIKVEGRWCYLYRAIDKEGPHWHRKLFQKAGCLVICV